MVLAVLIVLVLAATVFQMATNPFSFVLHMVCGSLEFFGKLLVLTLQGIADAVTGN